jgi:hypothetical protein
MTAGERARLDSIRCSKIINRNSGAIFERNLDPSARWAEAYSRALLCADEFEVVYDSQLASTVQETYLYTEAELRPLNTSELKMIATERGATGKHKSELINNILAAQASIKK